MENENNNLLPQPPQEDGRKKEKKSYRKGLLTGVLIMLLLVCGAGIVLRATGGAIVLGASGSALTGSSAQKLNFLERVIDAYYYKSDDVSESDRRTGMYKGLVESLDDVYSTYYTADEYKELTEQTSGTFYGIGAYVSYDTEKEYCVIAGVIDDSPAQKAGVKEGDIIYKVDGKTVTGMASDEVVKLIRGDQGTKVNLTVIRDGEETSMEITRDKVDSTTVNSKMLDGGVGYLQITEFDDVTTDQFTDALNDLKKQGMKYMILDLRSNPGGNVTTVTDIAKQILPKGMIFYMQDKNGKKTEYTCDGADFDYPLAVLVNGYSASASEILSGAIQDAGIGTIIGTQTYGKGVVQTIFPLDDGTAVKLTVADYYTRNGRSINKVGITPDDVIEFDSDSYQKDGTDNQLNEAVAVVTGEKTVTKSNADSTSTESAAAAESTESAAAAESAQDTESAAEEATK